MPTYSAGTASVDIKPNFSGFVRSLRRDLDRVRADLGVDINPNLAGFANALSTELRRVNAELDVAIRPGSMAAFSAALQADLARVNADITVGITPDLDTVQVAVVDAQIEHLARTRIVSIVPELDTIGVALLDARLEQLARDRTVNINVNQSGGLSNLASQSDNAYGSLHRMSGLKFTALATGIAALVPVLLGAAGAAGGLLAVLGAVGGVAAIGGTGVIDAFSTMKDATEGASQAAKDHSRDLDQVADAQQRVIDSQHNEMDSLQRVEDAQKSLTQARVDAKDAMDNLNLSVKNGQLSEKGAELAYRRAVRNLRKVQREAGQGKATGLDVEQAQYEVDTAAQNITNVRVRNQQTVRDRDDANSKGVEGSDQVVAAQQQLAQAQYGVQQAQVQTAQAVRDLARAQEDAAKSGLEAAGVTDKFQQALARLSPNARDFVLQMQALGPAWKDLRLAVQDNLFAGLGDSFTEFANNQLPAMKDGFSQIATGMNVAIKDTLSSLDGLFTEMVNNGQMQAFIDGVNQAMQGMAPFITGLTDAFIQLGAIVGPHLGPFFAALGKAISELAGPLGRIGGVFLDTLTALMPTLTDLVTALADGLSPVLPVIGRLLNSLGQALIPLIPPLSQILQILGNALADALDSMAPYLPMIAQAFADVMVAVSPLVAPLAQIAGIFAGAIATNISSLATALAPVIEQLADGLQPVLPILTNAFTQLTPILAQAAGILGQAMVQALEKIMPVLPDLITAWTDMLIAIAPLLPELAKLGAELLPILADILVELAPHLVTLLERFTDFVNFIVPILIPVIRELATEISDGWDRMKTVWEAMERGLELLKEKFSEIVGRIKEIWNGLVDTFKKDGLGGVAVKAIEKAIDLIPGRAQGGIIDGPGTATSDSIIGIDGQGIPTARVSKGEYVVNARSTSAFLPILEAINSGSLPAFKDGGAVRGSAQKSRTSATEAVAGASVVDSMAAIVAENFPGMTLTSGVRNSADYHGSGKAADFSNGTDSTPEMRSLAQFIATNYPDSLELIHSPFGHNIKNGQDVGDGLSTYGADTMAEHRNHVHWAIGSPVSAPAAQTQAPGPTATPATPEDAQDPSNYSPTGTYVGPSSVDTSMDEDAESGLPEEYSLQGIFSKAGGILATGLLSAFGLENSILSSSNTYNRAANTAYQYYSDKNAATEDAGPVPDTTHSPTTDAAPETPTAPEAPQKHTYNPGGGAEQWRGTVLTVLRGTGRNDSLADRTLSQIGIESGGDPNAVNDWDINAQNGTPSIGLLQVIKPTFDANADPRFPGGQRDPEANIAAALNYVDGRYKGAANIWPTTAGYATGGWVFGEGTSTSDSNLARLSNGEFVVNARSAADNAGLLQAINAGAGLRTAALPAGLTPRGGDVRNTTRDHSVRFEGPVQVMDVDHLMREQDRWTSFQAQGAMAAL